MANNKSVWGDIPSTPPKKEPDRVEKVKNIEPQEEVVESYEDEGNYFANFGSVSTPKKEEEKSNPSKDLVLTKNELTNSKKSKELARVEKDKIKALKKRGTYQPVWNLSDVDEDREKKIKIAGIIGSIFVALVVFLLYYNYIMYPPEGSRNVAKSGLGCMNKWNDAVHSLSAKEITSITGESKSYLAMELDYANEDENIKNFMKLVTKKCNYTATQVQGYDIYGNPLKDKKGNLLKGSSLLNNGENVYIEIIDYKNVPLDAQKIQDLMKQNNLTYSDADFMDKGVAVFCQYMCSLEDLPTKVVEHKPYMSQNAEGYYSMQPDEEYYLDNLLFANEDFYDLLDNWSLVASGGEISEVWKTWNEGTQEEKRSEPEPQQSIGNIQPTESWNNWNATDVNTRDWDAEPQKYESRYVLNKEWCGAYHLQNELVDENGATLCLTPPKGKGTFEKPAAINTFVLTNLYLKDSSGVEQSYPIKIRIIDYKVSDDATDYFKLIDNRNRGFNTITEVQYMYAKIEIINLSGETIRVSDDMSLADSKGNLSARTGTIYNLQSEVVIPAYSKGFVESWSNSTELNKKYVIWGASYGSEHDKVWFRLLAGDIDDTSEEKGVNVDRSRYED